MSVDAMCPIHCAASLLPLAEKALLFLTHANAAREAGQYDEAVTVLWLHAADCLLSNNAVGDGYVQKTGCGGWTRPGRTVRSVRGRRCRPPAAAPQWPWYPMKPNRPPTCSRPMMQHTTMSLQVGMG